MKPAAIAQKLWGEHGQLRLLLLAAAVLLFAFLGAREIWTQEHRWADIVSGMFYRHDFLHPYLGTNDYYDKPLLSYWLIALCSKLTGALTNWELRIPSAAAGLLATYAIYQLGSTVKNRQLGLLAGWLLITTYYFIFWARVSSADMLNLADSLFAVSWYYQKRLQPRFIDFVIFFVILALTSLCKGLIGAIVPLLAIFPDVVMRRAWKQYLRLSVFLAMLPGIIVYILPFWASSHFAAPGYQESGLYLVYRENVLRYFQPFDHKGPIYTYLLYLPIYTLPWAPLLLAALYSLPRRWRTMTPMSKWVVWVCAILFLFLTVSGSRRSYYVLPLLPFAILMIADWLLDMAATNHLALRRLAGWVLSFYVILFLLVAAIPAWFYGNYGINRFASDLKTEASKIQPWSKWTVVMLDAESKLDFYLQLPPTTLHLDVAGKQRDQVRPEVLAAWWPILAKKDANTIFISRKQYLPVLQPYLRDYHLLQLTTPSYVNKIAHHEGYAPIAFIPVVLRRH